MMNTMRTPAETAEVESRRAVVDLKEVGGTGRAIGSGWMSCDVADSWADHATSLGMNGPVEDSTLDELVEYYRSRNRVPKIKVTPYQHPTLFAGLAQRGFSLVESETLLIHSLDHLPPVEPPSGVEFRPMDPASPGDVRLFRDAQVAGFHSGAPAPEGVLAITDRMARSTRCRFWIIEVDGVPAGSGGVEFHEASSVLISGCTAVEFRSRGLQSAFIRYRLQQVAEHGAAYALLGSLPGETTERNALRAGFSPCFTQMLLQQS